nr:probable pyridoxal 5'-phosphate synthase subunit PDX1 [Ipomoea batatas]
MSGSGVVTLYSNGAIAETTKKSPFSVKVGLAQMLRGGVIMDVVNAEQARIAEEAGACAVMALERVPADIRAQGGVARMSDPQLIKEIKQAVTIPVMAKARIGHFVEAQILEAIGIDYVDESEVLTLADDENHINKHNFRVPFVCGCRNLGEALRRVREGAAMIRTKGEAGTGNIIEAVRHVRSVMGDIRVLRNMDDDEVFTFAKKIQAPYDLVMQTKQLGRLPVVHFAAGGVATPADAALMMQLGCDGVFVGSGVFKSGDPARRARAIVQAVTHYSDPEVLADISCGLGEAMVGINLNEDNVERSYSTDSCEAKGFVFLANTLIPDGFSLSDELGLTWTRQKDWTESAHAWIIKKRENSSEDTDSQADSDEDVVCGSGATSSRVQCLAIRRRIEYMWCRASSSSPEHEKRRTKVGDAARTLRCFSYDTASGVANGEGFFVLGSRCFYQIRGGDTQRQGGSLICDYDVGSATLQ